MSSERVYKRTIKQLLDDIMWLDQDYDPESRRQRAAAEVLRALPDEEYNILKARWDSFLWFLPDWAALSSLEFFPVTEIPDNVEGQAFLMRPYTRVLYLSPVLEVEDYEDSVAMGAVAYQLARIIAGSNLRIGVPEDQTRVPMDPDRLKRALELTTEWGFQMEVEEFIKYSPWSVPPENPGTLPAS